MSQGADSPSHRFTAPTWMLALTGVLALAFPVTAIGLFLIEGWSGATVVTLALVPLALLGVAEAVGRKVELYPDRLVAVANLRRTTYARSAFAAHLARMHAQRVALFEALAGVPEEHLWARAASKKWSPGEHLDHTRVLNGSFRRLLMLAWPVVSPWPTLLPGGRSRLERPYATEIDDVYQRPNMPKWVGFMWPPKRTPSRPASLAELERVLAEEHAAIARFYADKPEPLLGHLSIWDPAIGRLSLVQVLRVGVHHDLHHYGAVRRLLGR